MKKFDRFKNELYSKLPAIFFILLFVAYMSVSMNKSKIDNFFGFPDVHFYIEDENSELLNFFIDYKDISPEWELTYVSISQTTNPFNDCTYATSIIKGEYKQNAFILQQYIGINSYEGRYNNSDDYHYQEIYLDNDHAENEINTYCYLVNSKNSEIHDYTSCTILQITETKSNDIKFDISGVLTKQEAIQITDELKSMMQSASP